MIYEYPLQVFMNDSIRELLFKGIIQIKNKRIVMTINLDKPIQDTENKQSAQEILDSIQRERMGR